MRLHGAQLVLDTNILVYWLRGKRAAEFLRDEYELGNRRPRPIVPVVVKGETRAFAVHNNWGTRKLDALDELMRQLPIADIGSDAVVARYAALDVESRSVGRKMGKNDLWIAAVAAVQGATVLTTDKDFDHLHPTLVSVERVVLPETPQSATGSSP